MGSGEKLIKVASYNTALNSVLGTDFASFAIYKSKGLLTHLVKRKHFVASKYIDCLEDIIKSPDYAGYSNGNILLHTFDKQERHPALLREPDMMDTPPIQMLYDVT